MTDKLWLPKKTKETIEKEEEFTTRMACHRSGDIKTFIKACDNLGAIFCGMIKVDVPKTKRNLFNLNEYACIYQYKEDIEIEVLC